MRQYLFVVWFYCSSWKLSLLDKQDTPHDLTSLNIYGCIINLFDGGTNFFCFKAFRSCSLQITSCLRENIFAVISNVCLLRYSVVKLAFVPAPSSSSLKSLWSKWKLKSMIRNQMLRKLCTQLNLKILTKTLIVFWKHINIRFLQTLINTTWVNLMTPKHDLEVA